MQWNTAWPYRQKLVKSHLASTKCEKTFGAPDPVEELTAFPRPIAGGSKNPTPTLCLSGIGYGPSDLAYTRPLMFRHTRAKILASLHTALSS